VSFSPTTSSSAICRPKALKTFMPTTRHGAFIALWVAISPILFHPARADRTATSPPAKDSANVIQGYVNWIVDQTGWPTADIPPIKTISLGDLAKMLLGPLSGLEGIRPAA